MAATQPSTVLAASSVLPPVTPRTETTRARWRLHLEASMWRALMEIGMILHRLAPPRAPGPSFKCTIPATVSPHKGDIKLLLYTPPKKAGPGPRPVVVNFHGGGFTIGKPHDDVRWCRAVVEQVDAVVVSVGYRLAPEYPFPTAVEDGVDAILYLVEHAQELDIDPTRIGISGFSAGGNMSFTVPLRLHSELSRRGVQGSTKISVITAWYPSTDFTPPRSARRQTNTRPEKELPKFFTDLFDASYLSPSEPTFSLDSPFLSPGVAPTELLREALPQDILMYTCEWDELLAEGERFKTRLDGEVRKSVRYTKVLGVGHGFDKGPNPFWRDPQIDRLYTDACKEMKRVLWQE